MVIISETQLENACKALLKVKGSCAVWDRLGRNPKDRLKYEAKQILIAFGINDFRVVSDEEFATRVRDALSAPVTSQMSRDAR